MGASARSKQLRCARGADLARQRRLVLALAANLRAQGEAPLLIETHISYVLVTAAHAYKIKKAVNLEFLDFTTLASRHFYCREELRLNRRLAPELYLDVIAIGGERAHPRLGAAGPVLEYALKMRAFAQDDLADALLRRGALEAEDIDALARALAAFHAAAPVASAQAPFGDPARVLAPALQNFDQMRAREGAAGAGAQLRAWTAREFHRLEPEFAARKRGGLIRECHGDLHLGNIARVDGVLTPFDGIDFNAELRWIDVINEVAFLMMDLEFHRRRDLAYRFLNAYLEQGGDYPGVALLRFYQVYRAVVRAKVALLRAAQAPDPTALRADAAAHLRYALACARQRAPAVIITHGLSGSGKTTATQFLYQLAAALRIRSDIERKRLFGLSALARTGSAVAAGMYSAAASERTYARLLEIGAAILAAGYPLIVDAAFLRRAERDQFRQLARSAHAPFFIVDFQAPEVLLRARIGRRQREARDASEADAAVLDFQLRVREPLGNDEQADAVVVDCAIAAAPAAAAWEPLLARLREARARH